MPGLNDACVGTFREASAQRLCRAAEPTHGLSERWGTETPQPDGGTQRHDSSGLHTGKVTEDVIDPRFVDFPRVHPANEGRPYRYGYGIELSDWATGSWQRAIARKYDMSTGVSQLHDFGPSRLPGELVLAPRPGATAEDDAWAIAFVYDRARAASDLVILDAQHFEGGPVATVRLPFRVPVGLHGAWFAD